MTDPDRVALRDYLLLMEMMGVRYVRSPGRIQRAANPRAAAPSRGSFAAAGAAAPARPVVPVAARAAADGAPKGDPVARLAAAVGAAAGVPGVSESLQEIRSDLGDCKRCKLCEGRRTIVFGDGTPQAELVFVGEGPGADEDAQGVPFVGAAGQLLNKIIGAMGLAREQVYICNIVKCRPPKNRVPEEDEIRACVPFLVRQIESIRPRAVCGLGATAVQTLTESRESMGRVRGNLRPLTIGRHATMFMATYHPAYLLRSPDKKREVWEDVQKIMAFLKA